MKGHYRRFIVYSLFSCILLYLFSAASLILFADSGNETNELSIISHRGAAGLAPENTLSAIEKGIEFNADRIEVDVQQTKDSVIILMHDKTIDRTTDGKGKVKDLTYKEILAHNEKVPTLDEAIKLIKGKSTLLIEIKQGGDYYPGIEKRVIDLICRNKARDLCIVQSFNDKALQKVHELDSTIVLHKLFILKFPFVPVYIDKGINFTSLKNYEHVSAININHFFATKRLIDKIHESGKKINVWTINDSTKIRKLKKRCVDGVITDYPDIVH